MRPVGAVQAYLLLMKWNFLRQRRLWVMFVAIQLALGIGIVYGFAFLIPRMTATVALFFSTGAATLTLVLIGLVVVPQEVAQGRVSGRQAYIEALPIPRVAPMLADVSFWVLMQLPGAVATLLLAVLRFHVSLHLSPLVVPAAALTALTAASVGCATSMSLPPAATQQITQFASIGLLLFSPINFPMSRLPTALQDIHRGLPVVYMADIMRGSLTGHYDTSRVLAFAVVAAWCAFGLALSARAAGRRR
jgi:ABC-2 type transport system permease protein